MSCFAAVWAHLQTSAAQDKTGSVYVPLNPLVDVDGVPATEPHTPLYSRIQYSREAIIAPDGNHVTLEEWLEVGGEGHVTRTPQGTELSLELTTLVAGGVYTVWGFYFTDPPFNFSPFIKTQSESVASGAIGAADGSESRLDADGNGNATYVATIPAGPLSISGEVQPWVLDRYSSFAVVGVYDIDGQTYGTVPGPHHVGHFAVGFVPEPSGLALAVLAAGALGGTACFPRKLTPSAANRLRLPKTIAQFRQQPTLPCRRRVVGGSILSGSLGAIVSAFQLLPW
jgi:hypothetical protein